MLTFASRASLAKVARGSDGEQGEVRMARTGERKAQILQTLAAMLEDPKGERITTALLAARLEVSEAALYRHFASKAEMFEGLIEFIEQTVFTLVNKIQAEEADPMKQVESTVTTLLAFAQKNPGMTRVLIGDALVNEDERLLARVNQLLDRLEATLRQSARLATTTGALPSDWDVNAYANAVLAFVLGRWHQFAKSGFRRAPLDGWPQQWRVFAA
jgi:TetR/AcrR family transcriptional regulator